VSCGFHDRTNLKINYMGFLHNPVGWKISQDA
jgi:hypothetical protein